MAINSKSENHREYYHHLQNELQYQYQKSYQYQHQAKIKRANHK